MITPRSRFWIKFLKLFFHLHVQNWSLWHIYACILLLFSSLLALGQCLILKPLFSSRHSLPSSNHDTKSFFFVFFGVNSTSFCQHVLFASSSVTSTYFRRNELRKYQEYENASITVHEYKIQNIWSWLSKLDLGPTLLQFFSMKK